MDFLITIVIDFVYFDKDEDQDVGSSTLNDTISNTTYKRDKIPSINSKKSERVYNFMMVM